MIPTEVRRLCVAWRDWQDEPSFPLAPSHCINGTRIASRALQRLGIPARPVSVGMMLFNAEAWTLVGMRVPLDQWPPTAWSIGISDADTGEGWGGHLVVEGDGWTLDVSARQFDRPGRINVPEPWVFPMCLPADGSWATLEGDEGERACMWRWPENRRWRTTPAWRNLHDREVVELIDRMGRVTS